MAEATLEQVANYLIWRLQDAGDPVTHLKLQKLVYYAQAWHLALYDTPLLDETFEAWVHGPVCRNLYRQFSHKGWQTITLEAQPETPSEHVCSHLDDVLEAYGSFGAWALERLVHEETPWKEARGALPLDAPCDNRIDNESMRRFYAAMRANAQNQAPETA